MKKSELKEIIKETIQEETSNKIKLYRIFGSYLDERGLTDSPYINGKWNEDLKKVESEYNAVTIKDFDKNEIKDLWDDWYKTDECCVFVEMEVCDIDNDAYKSLLRRYKNYDDVNDKILDYSNYNVDSLKEKGFYFDGSPFPHSKIIKMLHGETNKKRLKANENKKSRINESKESSGLMVIGRTKSDNDKIGEFIKSSDYWAEWNEEGYWLFDEKEETYDALERELDKEFIKLKIDARFDGIFKNENMKKIELKQIVKEEIKRILKETNSSPKYVAVLSRSQSITSEDLNDFISKMESNGYKVKRTITAADVDKNYTGLKYDRKWSIGAPEFSGILGPMKNGEGLRYETQSVYNAMSQ